MNSNRLLRAISIAVTSASLAVSSLADIIITEIMYDSTGTDVEWVELYNNGATVDINGWGIDDIDGGGSPPQTITNDTFNFASGAILILGEDTRTDFNTEWSTSLTASEYIDVAAFPGLQNTGDDVRILDDLAVEQSALTYTESPPWPGDAVGASINFTLNPATSTLNDMTNGVNWAISFVGDGYSSQSQAPDISVGSPGIVLIPEPSTMAAFLLGLLAISALRGRNELS